MGFQAPASECQLKYQVKCSVQCVVIGFDPDQITEICGPKPSNYMYALGTQQHLKAMTKSAVDVDAEMKPTSKFTADHVKYFLKHRKIRLSKLYAIRAVLADSDLRFNGTGFS